MGSAWGNSWGASWGNSWGETRRPIFYSSIWIYGDKPKKKLLRKQKKARKIAQEIEETVIAARRAAKENRLTVPQAAKTRAIVDTQLFALSLEYERLGNELGVLQEALKAKEEAIARVSNAWRKVQEEIRRQEITRQQQEDDDLENLYLLMVML